MPGGGLIRAAAVAGLCWVLGCSPAPQQADPAGGGAEERGGRGVVAFVDVTVVPMRGAAVLPHRTVLVRGGRIAAIGAAGAVEVPESALHIDGRGRYLIPGLVDMHVHLPVLESEADLPLYVANGVTTVRNMDGKPFHLEWRRSIEAGERLGPALYTSSPALKEPGSMAEVEAQVVRWRGEGYDFVKVYSGLSRAEYQAAARTARREGIPLVGHVPEAVGVRGVLVAGQATIEHAEDLLQVHFDGRPDRARLPELAALLAGSRACVCPTLVVFGYVVRHMEEFPSLRTLRARPEVALVDPGIRRWWEPDRNPYVRRWRAEGVDVPRLRAESERDFAFMKEMVSALHRAGVPLVAGSDASVPFVLPGFSLIEELRLLVDAGLTPRQALEAATVNAARCLGAAGEIGTVEVGRRADLVLLEADPLADVAALEKRAGVMLRGRWLAAPEIRRLLNGGSGRAARVSLANRSLHPEEA